MNEPPMDELKEIVARIETKLERLEQERSRLSEEIEGKKRRIREIENTLQTLRQFQSRQTGA
jgi:predicted  nucleic acid-binding Zn-ribbon protein